MTVATVVSPLGFSKRILKLGFGLTSVPSSLRFMKPKTESGGANGSGRTNLQQCYTILYNSKGTSFQVVILKISVLFFLVAP